MKIRDYVKSIAVLLISGILAGAVLMIMVYLLPAGPMKEHVFESTYIFEEEGRLPQLIPGDRYTFTCLDNYTDAIMLNSAVYDGEGTAVEKAMNVYRREYEELADTCESLIAYSRGETGYYLETYARYWHGYLIYLKPLLLFFNYKQIRIFNLIVQTMMLIGVLAGMLYRKLHLYVPAFTLSIFFLVPAAIPISLQYASLGYVLLLSMLLLVWNPTVLQEKKQAGLFFCAVGMASSYVDLLTFPPITLAFLLVLYLILKQEEWLEQIKDSILYMLLWGIGYAGMWCGKWLAGSILLRKNILADAVNSIGIRTSGHDFSVEFTYGEVLYKNFLFLDNALGKILLGLTLLAMLAVVLFQSRQGYERINVKRLIPYLLIGSIPFVWYYVLRNHVFIHARFTFRISVIVILALQFGIISLRKKKEKD